MLTEPHRRNHFFAIPVAVLVLFASSFAFPAIAQECGVFSTNPCIVPIPVKVAPVSTNCYDSDDAKDSKRPWGNSAQSFDHILDPLRRQKTGEYAKYRQTWRIVDPQYTDLRKLAKAVTDKYSEIVYPGTGSNFSITAKQVKTEYFVYQYPAGFFRNTQPADVETKKITVEVSVPKRGSHTFTAYVLRWKEVEKGREPSYFINGHWGDAPSRVSIGLEPDVRGGASGASAGRLALCGVPVITFDPALGPPLQSVLIDLDAMDRAVLRNFGNVQKVNAVGLSGGAERLFHQMMISLNLRTAYFAGYFQSPWTRNIRGVVGLDTDPDTDNREFQSNFQWSELAAVGISRGTRLAFASNTYEDGANKNSLFQELLPELKRIGVSVYVGGDDPLGTGVPGTNRPGLCHEIDIDDYLRFLKTTCLAK